MSIDLSWVADQFPILSDIKHICSGGQKWVFKCIHPTYGICAFKIFKPGKESRSDRELEAVKRLSSENIAKIYEVNIKNTQIGSILWILEQYINGTLLSILLQGKPLGRDELFRLALGLITAAAAAEKMKVVHRDIKPDNIIIDSRGNPWLLDFGIARILDLESRTRTDAKFGPHTLGYGSPEQCRNRKVEIDGRTDLFAIGIVLYESATGINPFLNGARDRFEIIKRVEQMEIEPLNLSWDANKQFSDFVSSLTQKYSYRRPNSCSEALNWIQDILKNKDN